jgi:esterase/lipase
MINKSIFLSAMFLASFAGGEEEGELASSSFFITTLGASHIKSIKNLSEHTTVTSLVASLHLMGAGKVVKKMALPLNRKNPHYQPIGWGTGSEKITIYTLDGIRVTGNWSGTRHAETVIMFHGNGMNADDCKSWAQWFNRQGFNALALTIQGYPGSDGSSKNLSSASALLVEAAFRFALDEKKISLDKIAVYGFSLGGIYATYAGRYLGVPIILQNTFTTTGDMPQNIISKYFPPLLGRAIARSNFDYQPPMPDLESFGSFAGRGSVPLNSCNNIENLKNIESPVMILFGEKDRLMGGEKGAQELYKGRYGATTQEDPNLFFKISKGAHGNVFLGNLKAEKQIAKFLHDTLK